MVCSACRPKELQLSLFLLERPCSVKLGTIVISFKLMCMDRANFPKVKKNWGNGVTMVISVSEDVYSTLGLNISIGSSQFPDSNLLSESSHL